MLGSDGFCHASGVGEQKVVCVAVAEVPLSMCSGGGSNGVGPLAALLSIGGAAERPGLVLSAEGVNHEISTGFYPH